MSGARHPARVGLIAVLLAGLSGAVGPNGATGAQSGPATRSPVVGAWRVTSYDVEFQDTGERRPALGAHPRGYLLFGEGGRMMAYLEAGDRTPPRTDADRAAAYRGLVAYTGRYRARDGGWTTSVDGAWNVDWTGTQQERFFTLRGDRLDVVAQWNANALYGGRMTRGHLTFERER